MENDGDSRHGGLEDGLLGCNLGNSYIFALLIVDEHPILELVKSAYDCVYVRSTRQSQEAGAGVEQNFVARTVHDRRRSHLVDQTSKQQGKYHSRSSTRCEAHEGISVALLTRGISVCNVDSCEVGLSCPYPKEGTAESRRCHG